MLPTMKRFIRISCNRNLYSSFSTSISDSTAGTTTVNNSSSPHQPVLCYKAVTYLDPKPGNVYIDMTFGAGGHTKKILNASENVKIFALDRDPVAYEYAKLLNHEYPDQVIPLFGKFSEIPILLNKHNCKQGTVDGILFDFGCSSMQFDEANRGFSLSQNGPLDMRMDRGRSGDQLTAADVLSKIDEYDLVKILRVYGEEKSAKKIARKIIEARSALHRIETTKQLADLVASCMTETHKYNNKLQRPIHRATKTFQALRIFVNNELNEINYGMILAHKYLKRNGKLVTITFHSLEDTIVKRHLNGNVIEGLANPVPLKYCSHDISYDKVLVQSLVESNWKQLNKHVIVPDDDEIAMNPRSRSAKLRAAVKIK